MKKGILALFVSVITMTTAGAQQPFGRGFGPGQGWNQGFRPGPGIESLISDLTDDQKAALQQLRTDHYAKMKDHRNQMGELRARQRTIMSEYNIDDKAAQKLIDQKTELINKQMKEQVAHRMAVKEVLTEEQALQWEGLIVRRQLAKRKGKPGLQRGGYYGYRPNHGRNYGWKF